MLILKYLKIVALPVNNDKQTPKLFGVLYISVFNPCLFVFLKVGQGFIEYIIRSEAELFIKYLVRR